MTLINAVNAALTRGACPNSCDLFWPWRCGARRAVKAAQAVRAEGAEVVGVVTVVDRQEGAGEAFAAAGLALTAILTLADFK